MLSCFSVGYYCFALLFVSCCFTCCVLFSLFLLFVVFAVFVIVGLFRVFLFGFLKRRIILSG